MSSTIFRKRIACCASNSGASGCVLATTSRSPGVKSLSRLALASGRSQSLVKWLQPDSVLLLQVVVVPVNNSLTLGDCQFARPNILDPAGLRRFGPAISDNAQARHLCLIRAVRRPEPLELLHNLRLHKRTD